LLPSENMQFDLSGKTVWVAGETGLAGSALLRRLRQEDCKLLSAPRSVLDLTQQQEAENWLAENKPDLVFLAAARVGGIGANTCYPAEFIHDNLAISQNVIHGAYKAGVQKLVYLGSSCIYPKAAKQPISEEVLLSGPLEETNQWYAIAKIAGLKMCQAYRREYGCDFISVMPTNLYGPGDKFDPENSHVIPAMMTKMHGAKVSGAKEVELWGSGKPLREFLYVDDLADALVHAARYYSDEIPMNIGSGQEISIQNLAELIKKVVRFQGDVVFKPEKPDGTPRKFLDCTKLGQLGWRAQTSLEEGLHTTYKWFCEQKKSRAA